MTGQIVDTHLANGLTCALPADSPRARLLRSDRTWLGPTAKDRLAILRRARSVAIVGFSTNPARASYFVATYLVQSSDYTVYFVNPNAAGRTVLGKPVYASLAELPETPGIVDVFRKPADIPGVAAEVSALGQPSPVLWVQLGIYNETAARDAEAKGLTVVMDRCLKIEHARFHGGLHLFGFDTGQITARKTLR
jgi:predicted CoA-binding protein